MLCTQFYCNTPTHQESVWIHISVVSRSHFVITPSQSKSICPPLYPVADSNCSLVCTPLNMLPNISLAADISFCEDKIDHNRKQPSMSSSQVQVLESQSLSITINLITGDWAVDLPNLLSTCAVWIHDAALLRYSNG